ncbi:hypothetical protein ACVWWN_001902 [Mycobacterium sp. URHB0021]
MSVTATSANVATDDGVIPVRTGADVQHIRRSFIGQAGLLAVGALSAIQVANISVTALSLVCLLVVPGFLLMRHRGVDLVPLVLAALGWISFLASGLVNDVSVLWPNAMAPAGFSLYLMGFTVLTGRSVDRTATLLAGVAAGSVAFFVFQGIDLTHSGGFGNLWKYGIAHAVTILVLYGLIKARVAPLVPAIALTLLGLVSLGLNFRSHALVCLLAAAVFFAHRFLGSRLRRGWRFAVILVFGLLFAYVMPIVARTGLFGTALQKKTMEQDATDLPLLLVGRTEPPMNIAAILQRPILGWGSGQNFTTELYTQAEHLAVRMGYPATFPFDVYWRLPVFDYSATHSVLMGSWAEGGVLAVLLPLWLLVACLGIVWNYPRFGPWAPLAVTVGLQGIWDLMYTSWTYNMIPEHACIALLFCAVHFRREPSPP